MFIPLNFSSYNLIVMKSTFIAYVIPFTNYNNLENELNKIKAEHPKAKHYLYAYRFDNITRSNDDKEPGAIAKNFLSLINKRNINNVLIVVVRYFGGVKLGAARLLRTYLNAVSGALDNTLLGEEKNVYCYHLTLDYPTFNKIKALNYQLEDITFNDKITCSLISDNDILDKLNALKISQITTKKIKRVIQSKSHR